MVVLRPWCCRYMEWEALADWLRSAAGEMRQLVSEEAKLQLASMECTVHGTVHRAVRGAH